MYQPKKKVAFGRAFDEEEFEMEKQSKRGKKKGKKKAQIKIEKMNVNIFLMEICFVGDWWDEDPALN